MYGRRRARTLVERAESERPEVNVRDIPEQERALVHPDLRS